MKTTRHSLKALAAGALALCLTLTTLPAAGAALSDVADSDWYAQAVQYCWDNGMIEDNGDGTFSRISLRASSGSPQLDDVARKAIAASSGRVKRPKVLGKLPIFIVQEVRFQYGLR